MNKPVITSHYFNNHVLKLSLRIWPQTANSLYRAYKGRNIMSKSAREFFAAGLSAIGRSKPNWDYLPYRNQVEVTITLYPPDKRKRDIDNHVKATLDLITRAGIWLDDSQVDKLTVIRETITPGGLVEILIQECKQPTSAQTKAEERKAVNRS